MKHRYRLDCDVKTSFEPSDVARWAGGEWNGIAPERITGFSIDTRSLQPGNLFVALRGEHADGHRFLGQAVARGAAGVVVEDVASLNGLATARLKVDSTRAALGRIARGYRSTLDARMVAVTGSVGKTTVKELIADMVQPIGPAARTLGNWNNDLGLPLSLLAATPDIRFGVFEVGMNHPGELDPLCDILEPDVGVVTCVGPVHIENFTGLPAIAEEKAAVYRGLRGKGAAVLNADDAHADILGRYAQGNRMVTVSSRDGADYVYRRNTGDSGTFEVLEQATGDVVVFTAALPGDYFVLDAVLAAATARILGAPWPVITHAVQFYQPLALRWTRHTWFGVRTINDAYNANPVSVRAAVQAFGEEPVEGRRWLVLGGMLELGVNEERMHRETGAGLAAFPAMRLVTVGPRGRWLAEGALAAGMPSDRVAVCADHAAAAALLDDAVAPGDALLFKASRGEAVERVLEAWRLRRDASAGETRTANH
ncbi:MAG TPA: UDP-N-acetylmuramoyl-tripeptide--D-alanyl-D-alanine ligase [Kiritimatiellia bacterium]|nr:UDP-N-acetylmuramoyl-tripeptide--D-alanyl-D-alanine ligase [Kiritimatiellia bacterium]HMO99011.1 UDP-N-acetylmuramoyl-tripeptide--D-alanyl-D-alanine ligase [Kiritimatiellia bacterium]HMP95898.1 UDP-N-acetylmuramoyl-tripeptide--D-alanyl-D-alanine ligase [Kiritimatiellia bacterium]